uniref:SCP domain-containing protein n=1 Tax=Astyanax mexicanus TaxID=7994 RepID=A0A3B1K5E8_ASTMX
MRTTALGLTSLTGGSFEEEFLQTHNTYRKKHGAPRELCRSAQAWAEHLLSIKTLQHSSGGKFGENLFYTWSSGGKSLTGREAVDSWYNEVKDYNYSRPGFSSGTGHFTQVVWKDSKELGYGSGHRWENSVCCGSILPPGNFTQNPGAF